MVYSFAKALKKSKHRLIGLYCILACQQFHSVLVTLFSFRLSYSGKTLKILHLQINTKHKCRAAVTAAIRKNLRSPVLLRIGYAYTLT